MSRGDITASRALGAGMADSCAACHGRPRGAAGFGGDVATFPDSRDAPHLFGLGLVEMLADEMTTDLRAQRDETIDRAQQGPDTAGNTADRIRRFFGSSDKRSRRNRGGGSGGSNSDGSFTGQLIAKGINFGSITAFPDGTVDTSSIIGIDPDLRVKPFFHEGRGSSIREFIVGHLTTKWDCKPGIRSCAPLPTR